MTRSPPPPFPSSPHCFGSRPAEDLAWGGAGRRGGGVLGHPGREETRSLHPPPLLPPPNLPNLNGMPGPDSAAFRCGPPAGSDPLPVPPARSALPHPLVFRSAAAWSGSAAKTGSDSSAPLFWGFFPPYFCWWPFGDSGGDLSHESSSCWRCGVCGVFCRGVKKKGLFLGRWLERLFMGASEARQSQAGP